MPDGGDQLPSAVRPTKMPDPPAPETHSPVRIVVKMASPFAFRMTYGTSTYSEVDDDSWRLTS